LSVFGCEVLVDGIDGVVDPVVGSIQRARDIFQGPNIAPQNQIIQQALLLTQNVYYGAPWFHQFNYSSDILGPSTNFCAIVAAHLDTGC
jgi:hypothetical protein